MFLVMAVLSLLVSEGLQGYMILRGQSYLSLIWCNIMLHTLTSQPLGYFNRVSNWEAESNLPPTVFYFGSRFV